MRAGTGGVGCRWSVLGLRGWFVGSRAERGATCPPFLRALRVFCLFALLVGSARGEEKLSKLLTELTPPEPGSFPAMPGFTASYTFGWSNTIDAASTEVDITRTGGRFGAKPEYQVVVTGGSLGMVRLLWNFEAEHRSWVDARTLRASHFWEYDRYSDRTITTNVSFTPEQVWRQRVVSVDDKVGKWKRIEVRDIFDMAGGLLFVRSQPLEDGDEVSFLAYPGDSPFYAAAKVEGRETIEVMGAARKAIRLSLKLRKIEVKSKKLKRLTDYDKFRGGQIWVSDDELRVPLAAQMQIFIGYVAGEMTSFELK